MEAMYRVLLALHIAAGTVALVTFWIAAFARKGSRLHVGTGIVVGIGMLRKCGVISTARNWWMQEHYSAMPGCGGRCRTPCVSECR